MTDTPPPPSPAPAPPSSPAPAPAAPARPAAGRGIRIALAISVALNLAVLGLGLGMALHGGPGGRHDLVRDVGFGPFSEALAPDERRDLRDAFLAKTPDFRAEREKMRADAAAVLQTLRAIPFDGAALDAALGTMQAHITARMDTGRDLMAEFLKAMTPEARHDFADRLEASLRHGPGPGD